MRSTWPTRAWDSNPSWPDTEYPKPDPFTAETIGTHPSDRDATAGNVEVAPIVESVDHESPTNATTGADRPA